MPEKKKAAAKKTAARKPAAKAQAAPAAEAARRPLPEEPIARGTVSDDVRWLQTVVGAMADGNYGARSEAALRRFQSVQGLAVDGVPGPKTWQRLNNEA